MRYFLDCEFDGFDGPLLSMALISETGRSMYAILDRSAKDMWVRENVIPVMLDFPQENVEIMGLGVTQTKLASMIGQLIKDDPFPIVIADWPCDIRYFCETIVTGPGVMIETPRMVQFCIARVDAYPTGVVGAIRHNAWWDALALKEALRPSEGS